MKVYTINGHTFEDTTEFAYDGCHKIYILTTPEAKTQLSHIGYEIYPISEIKEAYDNSCPLKFIDAWDGSDGNDGCDGFTTIIPQCTYDEDITWEGFI